MFNKFLLYVAIILASVAIMTLILPHIMVLFTTLMFDAGYWERILFWEGV